MNTDTTVPGYGFYLKKAYGPDPEPKKKKKKKKKMYVLKGSWMLGGDCESRKVAKFTSKRKAEDPDDDDFDVCSECSGECKVDGVNCKTCSSQGYVYLKPAQEERQ